jgi:hypothetical protein
VSDSTDVEIAPADLRAMEEATTRLTVHGARYPEELQKRVGR